jgi:hypothetical protein
MHESQQQSRSAPASWRGGYAEWIAVGALIAGSVGALIGATQRRRPGPTSRMPNHADISTVTAPHGDKLEAALR